MTPRPAEHRDTELRDDGAALGLTSLDACLQSLEDLLRNSEDDLLLQLRLTLLRATRVLHLCAFRPPAEVGAARRLGRDLIVVCDIIGAALPPSPSRPRLATTWAQA